MPAPDPISIGPNFNAPNNATRGNAGQRHDFSGFRNFHQNFRAARRFRAPTYRRPPGFYSRRWGWGEFLPTLFWARDYWLIDFCLMACRRRLSARSGSEWATMRC